MSLEPTKEKGIGYIKSISRNCSPKFSKCKENYKHTRLSSADYSHTNMGGTIQRHIMIRGSRAATGGNLKSANKHGTLSTEKPR